MGLRFQGVPEEHQQVDFALGDLGADLLVAAQRTAKQAMDIVPLQVIPKQPAGGAGGVEF